LLSNVSCMIDCYITRYKNSNYHRIRETSNIDSKIKGSAGTQLSQDMSSLMQNRRQDLSADDTGIHKHILLIAYCNLRYCTVIITISDL